MLGITDLKKDTFIQIDGAPYRVISYNHTSMGRGGATVRVKIKNLVNGSVVEKAFKNDEKIEPADLERKDVQYLYSSKDSLTVMDLGDFEQTEVNKDISGNLDDFFTEGSKLKALYFHDKIIGFDLPKNVVLKVIQAAKGEKGNTANSPTKEIVLETGLNIQAPLFIKSGDTIKVDTRSGQYLERAK